MNSLTNRVQLIGNVGADPEVRDLDSGKKVANFRLATNSSYRSKDGEKVKETQWHQVVAWGKTAEILEKYVKTGKYLAVEGKLTHRSYDDKEGKKHYVTEVVANEVIMLDKG